MKLEKYKLLCWKNFTLQKRHPVALILEILFPILIVLLFSFARRNVERENHEKITFREFRILNYSDCYSQQHDSIDRVGIAPSNEALNTLIDSMEISKYWKIEFFENSALLDEWIFNENNTVAGIEFAGMKAVSMRLPKGR